jgi:ribitol-5-phosphate 2-dehydrogenase (NADP+) / D-ribitol-5-phosphate cytidylyltransferase
MSTRRNVAVVLAGGTGSRVGLSLPKQLIKIAGKPIIEHTLAALNASPVIDEIIVMMTPGHLDAVRAITRSGAYPKVTRILEGAGTRNGTTQRALEAVGDEDCNLVFHDAVRPLVSQRIIADCVAALGEHDAVGTAIPASDTIVFAEGGVMSHIPPREQLWRCQTPQCFRLPVISRAHELAAADPGFAPTDDCGVVLRYLPDVDVHIVPGSERNLKITYPHDLQVAEALLNTYE